MVASIITGIKSVIVGIAAVVASVFSHPHPAAQQQIVFQNMPTSTSSVTTSQQTPISDITGNWAGYIASGGTYSGISGSWTVPNASGSSDYTSADATWIGIGGVTGNDLIQVGTQNVVAPNGQVSTSAFYELLPNSSQSLTGITVSPGDSITASITEISSGQWTIKITDNSNGNTSSTTVAYDSSESSADWIEEDPSDSTSSQIPLDNFGNVYFTGASTINNGSSQDLSSAKAQANTMDNSEGQALVTTSSIGSNGSNFSVTRSSASSGPSIEQYNQYPGQWRFHGNGIGNSQGSSPYSSSTTSTTSPEPVSYPGQWGQSYGYPPEGHRAFRYY